ncbi:MAG: amidase family protein, partial [Bacillota bacterium]|nr:amidase family protein [Bacillota bacterium]
TAGPMARTVEDAAILLTALMGVDENDTITKTNPLDWKDLILNLKGNDLKGLRIGIAREGFVDELNEEKKEIFEKAVDVLKGSGAAIVEDIVIPSAKAKWNYDVLTYEFKPALNAYLHTLHPSIPVRTLRDVIDFNKNNEEKMLKYGQAVMQESEKMSGSLTEEAYISALEFDLYHSTEQGIDFTLKEHQLDAIVFPSDEASHISAKAGYPTIAVPAGYTTEGEPVGVTFSGSAFSEPVLIKVAHVFEKRTKMRKKPILEAE